MIYENLSVIDILKIINLLPSKSKGQNFLTTIKVGEKIATLLGDIKDEAVLEIGGGTGSLSVPLSKIANNFTICEIEPKLVSYLQLLFEGTKTKVIQDDALKITYDSYSYIVSNLPYAITDALLSKIIKEAINMKMGIFMVQSEVFEKYYYKEGYASSYLGLALKLLGDLEFGFLVGADNFYPKPNVTSTIFTLRVSNKNLRLESGIIYKMAKAAFANPNKTLLNNFKLVPDLPLENIKAHLVKCGYVITVRAHEVKVCDFLEILRLFFK
jgi:16S rRNA A1518/A1519 N6-dimethyltransferase RsmA/KsgA/DIM1 with predicted DNA glycosylase/AP lyase activity